MIVWVKKPVLNIGTCKKKFYQIQLYMKYISSISDSVSSLSLKGTEYLSTLDADSHISLYVMATVKETSQVYLKREIYRVEQPNLELKVDVISTAKFIWPNTEIYIIKNQKNTNLLLYKNRFGW